MIKPGTQSQTDTRALPAGADRTIVGQNGQRRPPTAVLAPVALGAAGAVERLYDAYAGRAYALASRILSTSAEAEDVVQDALTTVWRTSNRYDPSRGSEAAWILTVVRNRALDRRRADTRQEAQVGISLDQPNFIASHHDTASAALIGLDREDVLSALAELPHDQRRAIDLAYFAGLTHVEIAAQLALPLGTVKGRIRLGLEKLAVTLRDRGHTR